MRHSSSKRLAQLKQKHEQLKAQIHTLEAAEQSRQRKQETRRKILIGAYYLNQAKTQDSWSALASLMNGYLTRTSDRKLFDLPPLDHSTSRN